MEPWPSSVNTPSSWLIVLPTQPVVELNVAMIMAPSGRCSHHIGRGDGSRESTLALHAQSTQKGELESAPPAHQTQPRMMRRRESEHNKCRCHTSATLHLELPTARSSGLPPASRGNLTRR